MSAKKLCLGNTVIFDRDEIMDAIYGMTPPLAVQFLGGVTPSLGQNWVYGDGQGNVQGDTALEGKLYQFLYGAAINGGVESSDVLTNGSTITYRKVDGLKIIIDSANAQLALDEYNRVGVSWYWCIHISRKVRLPLTKHFINATQTNDDSGKYSQDQIVDITGEIGITPQGGNIKSGVFSDSLTAQNTDAGTTQWTSWRMTRLNFKASNSPGVNVGQWVQPRSTALRLAFYVGFLKQSQFKNL